MIEEFACFRIMRSPTSIILFLWGPLLKKIDVQSHDAFFFNFQPHHEFSPSSITFACVFFTSFLIFSFYSWQPILTVCARAFRRRPIQSRSSLQLGQVRFCSPANNKDPNALFNTYRKSRSNKFITKSLGIRSCALYIDRKIYKFLRIRKE